VVAGTVIGSGIFKKPQVVAQAVPYFGVAMLIWIIGASLTLLGALSFAEVAVIYPRAGGNYVFLREGFGRLFGFLWGWVELWVIKGATIAALGTLLADCLRDVLAGAVASSQLEPLVDFLDDFWWRRGLSIGLILGLAAINAAGIRWGGVIQVGMTVIKLAALVGLMALPAWMSTTGKMAPVAIGNLEPVWPDSLAEASLMRILAAVYGVLWAYHGWMNIAPVAEEIRKPQTNIPRSLFFGVGIVVAMYLGANWAYATVIPAKDMASLNDSSVATAFAVRLLGSTGAVVVSAAVLASVLGTLNGNIMAGPRVLYAMSEDRLAPRRLASIHPRFRTPAAATMALASWACILITVGACLGRYRLPIVGAGPWRIDLNLPTGKPLFDVMTDFAMFGAVVFETLAVATIFVFRNRFPDLDRPYRCRGYPWVPGIYVLALAVIALSTFWNQRTEAVAGIGLIGLGAVVYALMPCRPAGVPARG
jgi:amino acid transporter